MEIQEIKNRLPITAVLKYYHLTPDRNQMLKCPFHEDKEASLKIYPKTNTFNCFGCDANGDVNSLLAGHEPEIFTHLLDSSHLFSLTESGAVVGNQEESGELQEEIDPNTRAAGSTPLGSPARLNTENPEQLVYETGELKVTIWGGIEQENLSRLKVSMHLRSKSNKYKSFRDDVNLYGHSGVQKLIQNISEALELSTVTVADTLTNLTEQLEAYRLEERTAMIRSRQPQSHKMSVEERKQSLAFLKDKDLGRCTMELIQQSGLIGEQRNGLLLFLLYLSRLNDDPLHAIIFGKSGSGKTYLQTRVSECLPEESVRTITSLTENT